MWWVAALGGVATSLAITTTALAGTQSDFAALSPSSPASLTSGHTLGEKFTVSHSFIAVGALAPAYGTTGSGATLVLTQAAAPNTVVASHTFSNIPRGSYLELVLSSPAQPGSYVLTMEDPVGTVGWWGNPTALIPGGIAVADGKAVAGDRLLHFLQTLSVQHFSQLFNDVPQRLLPGHTLGEEFVSSRAITSIAIPTPTWGDKTAAVTLTVFKGGPTGPVVAQKNYASFPDGGPLVLPVNAPAGEYTIQESSPTGTVGWYSSSVETIAGDCALADGVPTSGERIMTLTYTGSTTAAAASPSCTVAASADGGTSTTATSATAGSSPASSSTSATANPSTLPKTGSSPLVDVLGVLLMMVGGWALGRMPRPSRATPSASASRSENGERPFSSHWWRAWRR